MVKYLLFLLLISGIAKAQIVNIPDTAFKNILISSNVSNYSSVFSVNGNPITLDANFDGEIQESEAVNVGALYLNNQQIQNLIGIEKFTSLENFNYTNYGNSGVSTFNLSQNINLSGLNIYSNNLSFVSLDLGPLSQLEYISISADALVSLLLPINNFTQNGVQFICSETNLVSLDLSNKNLQSVSLFSNEIETINFANNPLLNSVYLTNNKLTSLNLTGFPNLYRLYCNNNLISGGNLILTGCTNLDSITVSEPLLESLDLSTNTNLQEIYGYNPNLKYLNIKNGINTVPFDLRYLLSNSATSSTFICADDVELNSLNAQIVNYNLSNVFTSSYCSFTPGGLFNTIKGSVYLDINANGCDSTDALVPNQQIAISDPNNSGSTFSNASGQYSFYSNALTSNLTIQIQNPNYFNASPASYAVGFPSVNNLTQTQNFCLTPNGVYNDVEIYLLAAPARPGFDVGYELVYKNKGNQVAFGSLNVNFDDNKSDFVSANPNIASQAVNMLIWNFSNLLPFETRKISFTLNINSPMDIPAVNNGDILQFNTIINPIISDITPLDNSFTFNQMVINSFDPNDITCLEGPIISPDQIGKYLHYKIRFENVGSAEAINIVVKDMIDTLKYDVKSLEFISSSHPVETKIVKNKVEFIFKNINLPSTSVDSIGSHGNVFFKIKTLPTLIAGAVVSNSANIYFDYNFPIETNIATTAFGVLTGLTEKNKDKSISVYPNPAYTFVDIESENIINIILLYDIQGRVLETVLVNQKQQRIEMGNKTKGTYLLKIVTEKGSKVERIVKD